MNVEFRAFHGPADWGWVNTQLGLHRVDDTNGIMAINSDENATIGACIMDNWTSNSVQCHFIVADPMLLKHGFLEECHDFVFNHSGREVVYGMVPANNEKAIKLNEHMGFTEKVRLENAYAPGVDYLVMELRKEDAKYLPEPPAPVYEKTG